MNLLSFPSKPIILTRINAMHYEYIAIEVTATSVTKVLIDLTLTALFVSDEGCHLGLDLDI